MIVLYKVVNEYSLEMNSHLAVMKTLHGSQWIDSGAVLYSMGIWLSEDTL